MSLVFGFFIVSDILGTFLTLSFKSCLQCSLALLGSGISFVKKVANNTKSFLFFFQRIISVFPCTTYLLIIISNIISLRSFTFIFLWHFLYSKYLSL